MGDFYGNNLYILQCAKEELLAKIELIQYYRKQKGQRELVQHCKGRIKSESSMIEKLQRKGLDVTVENAMTKINDAVGIRVVCNFIDDVYEMVELIRSLHEMEIIKEKDYIKKPKATGYRSYHLIVRMKIHLPNEIINVPAEIQIRTIAQDSWAALEHQLRYKKDIGNVELIQGELKRCSDEMASTDLTLQTVRQMIHGEL